MVADRPQLRRNHCLRSHSCGYADAATWAYPLPSSCAKRPDKPGRFLRMAAQKLFMSFCAANLSPAPQKKADTPKGVGLCQMQAG